MDKLELPPPISEIRTTAMLLILNYSDVTASSDMTFISSSVKLHPTFWNLTVGNQTTKRMAPEAYVPNKANTRITMKLTLMRLAAMLEHGETTVLRQRSCTTKLHTATHNTAITKGSNGCTQNYQLNSIYTIIWMLFYGYEGRFLILENMIYKCFETMKISGPNNDQRSGQLRMVLNERRGLTVHISFLANFRRLHDIGEARQACRIISLMASSMYLTNYCIDSAEILWVIFH